jgi:hypothetical protein
MILFLFHLSIKTPAIGLRTISGNIPKKFARLRITGSPVTTVNHHIMTKWIIDEPSKENNCPDQKKR